MIQIRRKEPNTMNTCRNAKRCLLCCCLYYTSYWFKQLILRNLRKAACISVWICKKVPPPGLFFATVSLEACSVLDHFFSSWCFQHKTPLTSCIRQKHVFNQGPITWSEQLSCVRVTAFSRTSLFLELFRRKFWISFKFHKPVSKTYRPKKWYFFAF